MRVSHLRAESRWRQILFRRGVDVYFTEIEALQLHKERAADLRAEADEYRLARSVGGRRRRRHMRQKHRDPAHGSARHRLP